jgi:hypothetical protein
VLKNKYFQVFLKKHYKNTKAWKLAFVSSIFKYFLKSPKKRIIRVCLNRIESMSLLCQHEDSPPWQHSPLIEHYQNCICFPIYNKRVKTIPPTFDVEVVWMKLCSLSDILHIFKELECSLLIILHSEKYYFIYCLQTCFLVGFAPPIFNAKTFIEDFVCMWKI